MPDPHHRVRAWLLLCFGLWACERAKPAPERTPPPVSTEALVQTVGAAKQLAAGDLDGNGDPELVLVDHEWLRVSDLSGHERARQRVPGGIQVLRVADIDGDGRAEILSGWGLTREHRDAHARASIYRLEGDALIEDLVLEPTSERAEIVEVLPAANTNPPRLLLAHFESKYMVQLAHAQRGANGWTFSPIDTIRMATSVALGDLDGDGNDDLIIGRVYGEGPDGEGDAFLLRPDGTRVPIPTVGGVRSLAVVDLDGDGRLELLLGDGWNRDYGRVARARLTRAWWDAGVFRTELLEDSEGQYTIWDILAIDLDRDGNPEIVTRGSAEVRTLTRADGRWQGSRVAAVCHDLLALVLAPEQAPSVLLACEDGGQILRR
jgi:hypothetical protein